MNLDYSLVLHTISSCDNTQSSSSDLLPLLSQLAEIFSCITICDHNYKEFLNDEITTKRSNERDIWRNVRQLYFSSHIIMRRNLKCLSNKAFHVWCVDSDVKNHHRVTRLNSGPNHRFTYQNHDNSTWKKIIPLLDRRLLCLFCSHAYFHYRMTQQSWVSPFPQFHLNCLQVVLQNAVIYPAKQKWTKIFTSKIE